MTFSPTDTCSILAQKNCTPCGCDTQGSTSPKCDASGTCACSYTFYGKKCSERNCKMNEWSSWSQCPCGQHGQQKTRSRTIQTNASGHGKRCPTNNVESAACHYHRCHCTGDYYGDRCDNRHCQWGSWSSWSSCRPCPGNCLVQLCPPDNQVPKGETKTRTRSITVQQAGNGTHCTGGTSQMIPCGDCVKTCTQPPLGYDLPGVPQYIMCSYVRT